jgi:hypothetical protein
MRMNSVISAYIGEGRELTISASEGAMRRQLSKHQRVDPTRYWICWPLDLGLLSLQSYEK